MRLRRLGARATELLTAKTKPRLAVGSLTNSYASSFIYPMAQIQPKSRPKTNLRLGPVRLWLRAPPPCTTTTTRPPPLLGVPGGALSPVPPDTLLAV